MLTIQQSRRKIYTHVPIPSRVSFSFHRGRYGHRVYVFYPLQDAFRGPKSDDDLRNSEQKRLYPELHELSFEIYHVSIAPNIGAGLQFYPVDGVFSFCGFFIPH